MTTVEDAKHNEFLRRHRGSLLVHPLAVICVVGVAGRSWQGASP